MYSIARTDSKAMISATKVVAASSVMLPLVTAQIVGFERGIGGGFRDEEHLAGKALSRRGPARV